MVRVYRQPDERLSTQPPERLTRTFNYTPRYLRYREETLFHRVQISPVTL